MDNQSVCSYRKRIPEILSSVTAAIGTHVTLIAVERSLWKTKMKYPEAELICFSEAGINLEGLDELDDMKAECIANEFTLSIIETLSRLVGIQVAQKLADDFVKDAKTMGVV